jgi:hypothetical protein
MTMTIPIKPKGSLLVAWWRRRREIRLRRAREMQDLIERFGPAACAIALSSSRQIVGPAERRFWRQVVGGMRRGGV